MPDDCVICLGILPSADAAAAAPCAHEQFHFPCLAAWLHTQTQPTCPLCELCKAPVTAVRYNLHSHPQTYTLPTPIPPVPSRPPRSRRPSPALVDPALARRRHVYRHRLHACHVGSTPYTGYRDVTPYDIATIPTLQSRARAFIRRELRVFPFLPIDRREYLLAYVLAIVKRAELRGAEGRAEELVGEFLGRANAELFCHELRAWLRSPFERLEEWDREVEYGEVGCC